MAFEKLIKKLDKFNSKFDEFNSTFEKNNKKYIVISIGVIYLYSIGRIIYKEIKNKGNDSE